MEFGYKGCLFIAVGFSDGICVEGSKSNVSGFGIKVSVQSNSEGMAHVGECGNHPGTAGSSYQHSQLTKTRVYPLATFL